MTLLSHNECLNASQTSDACHCFSDKRSPRRSKTSFERKENSNTASGLRRHNTRTLAGIKPVNAVYNADGRGMDVRTGATFGVAEDSSIQCCVSKTQGSPGSGGVVDGSLRRWVPCSYE